MFVIVRSAPVKYNSLAMEYHRLFSYKIFVPRSINRDLSREDKNNFCQASCRWSTLLYASGKDTASKPRDWRLKRQSRKEKMHYSSEFPSVRSLGRWVATSLGCSLASVLMTVCSLCFRFL